MKNTSEYLKEIAELERELLDAKYALQYIAYNYDSEKSKLKISDSLIESTCPVETALITIRNIDHILNL